MIKFIVIILIAGITDLINPLNGFDAEALSCYYFNNSAQQKNIGMETEIWKDIPGYEGFYQVSNLGRVKSLERVVMRKNGASQTINSKIINSHWGNRGYNLVNLYKQGKMEQTTVHRVMAKAFIPNPKNKRTVNHKNGIRSDNRIENLEWATYSENNQHKYDELGYVSKGMKGSKNPKSKPISQYTSDGKFIATYSCAREAYRKLGICVSCIGRVALGYGKTAGGYVWKFENNKNI